MGKGGAERKRQQRVKGSDMGKGGAKRKRQQRVKGSDMAKRKRYSSPPVNKSKGCSASDCGGDVASVTIEMKGWSSSDSDVAPATIEMKGLSSSDSDVPPATVEMMGLSSSDSDVPATVEMMGLSSSDSDVPATVEMMGLSSSDSDVPPAIVEMMGLSSSDSDVPPATVEMMGLSSSDSDVASATIEMKGWSSSDSDSADVSSPSIKMKECSAGDTADVSPPRKRVESVGCSANDGEQPGVSEDELSGQLLGDLEKVQYFGTTASGGDEQALQRTKNLSHSAFPDMKQSGCKEFDVKNLAEIFELQGNKAMQSKLYPVAIECYNVAIALGGDNAIYYCNRAAAHIQTCQYAEAILDCQKSIAIDPNYIKAYTRLGYIYFVQGIGALEKGYRIATLLDPTNEFERENVRAAEHIIWQQREESGQQLKNALGLDALYASAWFLKRTLNWSYSNGVMSVRDQVPSPLFGNDSGTGLRASAMGLSDTNPGELYAAIIADISFLVALRHKTNNSNGN